MGSGRLQRLFEDATYEVLAWVEDMEFLLSVSSHEEGLHWSLRQSPEPLSRFLLHVKTLSLLCCSRLWRVLEADSLLPGLHHCHSPPGTWDLRLPGQDWEMFEHWRDWTESWILDHPKMTELCEWGHEPLHLKLHIGTQGELAQYHTLWVG
jgi:hypothetical protein